MKIKTWRAGFNLALSKLAGRTKRPHNILPKKRASAGFSLFEMLIVITLIALTTGVISVAYRTPSTGASLRQTAAHIASRLRVLRSAAISTRTQKVAKIDVEKRYLHFGPGHKPIQLGDKNFLSVVAAQSEIHSKKLVGIRFYPNGSSTGGTIKLEAKTKHNATLGYEIRVNWLTGRVISQPYEGN